MLLTLRPVEALSWSFNFASWYLAIVLTQDSHPSAEKCRFPFVRWVVLSSFLLLLTLLRGWWCWQARHCRWRRRGDCGMTTHEEIVVWRIDAVDASRTTTKLTMLNLQLTRVSPSQEHHSALADIFSTICLARVYFLMTYSTLFLHVLTPILQLPQLQIMTTTTIISIINKLSH